jgi:hypothetical protein
MLTAMPGFPSRLNIAGTGFLERGKHVTRTVPGRPIRHHSQADARAQGGRASSFEEKEVLWQSRSW